MMTAEKNLLAKIKSIRHKLKRPDASIPQPL